MKTIKLLSLLLAGFMIFIYSCEKNEGTAKFNLYLTDAPASYDAVNIDVQSAKIHFESDGEGEWKTLDIETGIYNLLELTNGVDVSLASADLPSGTISQIRLILGENNSLVKGDETYDLTIPSAYTSGLKFNVHAQLEAGLTYNLWIDFDASKSVVHTGSGTYHLKPVIRTYTEATSGAIKGYVVTPILDSDDPIEYDPIEGVTVSISFLEDGNTENTVISTNTNEDGYFMLSGVPEGSYIVKFLKEADPAIDKEIEDVEVEIGTVNDLENIIIE
ncbi:MAG: DUF4382 domain-containing protein [Bacteroidota bacterium]